MSTVKRRGRLKKEKLYMKEKLPFVHDISNEEPIPALSPVLCNHNFPQVELVDADNHGLYWVSPQCHACSSKPKSRRRIIGKQRADSANAVSTHRCQSTSSQAPEVCQAKTTTPGKQMAKKRFLSKTKTRHRHDDSFTVIVPETPVNEQGVTLHERLTRKSKRLKRHSGEDGVMRES